MHHCCQGGLEKKIENGELSKRREEGFWMGLRNK